MIVIWIRILVIILKQRGFQGSNEETEAAIRTALEVGYRHIDTAYVYGTEKSIGEELHDWVSSGKLKRDDVYLTTKVSF